MNFWKNLKKPFTVLAPMEDVTDTVFRQLIAECGSPDVFFTEFTSTDGLCSAGCTAVSHRLKFTAIETPLIAQIWGNTPQNYYDSAKKLSTLGFAGIDINMGCPVSKVIKNGCCSALINTPDLAKELYIATVEGAGGLPVSIKTRIGFRTKQTEEWIGFLLSLKPSAITVHGRTAKQLSNYPADWNEIKKAVDLRNEISPNTVMIGNGDVSSQADIIEKHNLYKVDGLMVGRGIFKNPFIFNFASQISSIDALSPSARIDLMIKHINLFEITWQSAKPYAILKKYFKIYVSNFPGASELRVKLMESTNTTEAKEIALEFISNAKNYTVASQENNLYL